MLCDSHSQNTVIVHHSIKVKQQHDLEWFEERRAEERGRGKGGEGKGKEKERDVF